MSFVIAKCIAGCLSLGLLQGPGTYIDSNVEFPHVSIVSELLSDVEYIGDRSDIFGQPVYQPEYLITIQGKSPEASYAATYALYACRQSGLDLDGYYGCKNFVLTLNAENRSRNPKTISAMNRNKTFDHGICQLNGRYHKQFINSKDFNSIYNQIDYCLEVWHDAILKRKMPRYAYDVRHQRGTNVVFEKITQGNIIHPQIMVQ